MSDAPDEEPVIRSLRLPKSLDSAIKKSAESSRTSVNALVQEILTKYVSYDQYADELDYAVVTKKFLRKILDYMSEDDIRNFGKWVAEGPGSDSIRFYHHRPNLMAVLETYQRLGGLYSRLFNFHHERTGKDHVIRITHNMGRNWSVFYEANLRTMFKSNAGIEVDTDITDNIVIARFMEPS